MKISEVKRAVNKPVIYENSKYILTACILRKDKLNRFVYSAELKDMKANSIVIVKLEDVNML